ncbi:MAG: hypothetical protein ACJAZP_003454 [Psychromonas sp.]|jgi:hypothetical protein|uniref:ice-binding family protein n=1 Tax=Psychromonas sp. TaxID=1884585 RepID=UPI0039E4533E
MLTVLVTGCNSSNDTSSEPGVIQEVALNHKVIATFSEAVVLSTLTEKSFSVVKDADGVVLSGDFNVDDASHTASFTPAEPGFTADTVYTVTLTTDIKNLAAPGADALTENKVWQFTSGAAVDAVAPSVDSTTPADTATHVVLNRPVSANFSEALDPATVNKSTFTLSDGGSKVSGVVRYSNKVATFTSTNNLTKDTIYTATLTTDINDLADLALATKTWTFKTGSTLALGPLPVNIGTAGDFAILSKTGITNTDSHASDITGDIGASGISATSMSDIWCSEITGTIYGDDAGMTTPCYTTSGKAASAVLDMGTAYTDAKDRKNPDDTDFKSGLIGGTTIDPGLYRWGSDVNITTDVTLSGGKNDVWIFQISNNVIQAKNTHVFLKDGALAKNVFWQVAGKVTLHPGADFAGIVLAKTLIAVETNAAVNGRLLSQTAVTLDQNKVTQPAE